ncbi:24964_t:CDS:2, partial [Gigaspora rosea]
KPNRYICLSETHLSLKESKFSQLSKNLINYQNFWSPSVNNRQAGNSFPSISLQVIQIYYPAKEKTQQRKDVLKQINSLIQNSKHNIILMDYTDILDTIPTNSDHNIVSLEVIFSSSQNQYKQPSRK